MYFDKGVVHKWSLGLRGVGSKGCCTKTLVIKSVTMGGGGRKLSKIQWRHLWTTPKLNRKHASRWWFLQLKRYWRTKLAFFVEVVVYVKRWKIETSHRRCRVFGDFDGNFSYSQTNPSNCHWLKQCGEKSRETLLWIQNHDQWHFFLYF